MNIIKKSRNFTMKELYDLARSPENEKLSTIKGDTIPIMDYLVYDNVDSNGEIVTIASIKDRDTGVVYVTNSKTFVSELLMIIAMCEEAGEELHHVKVVEGISRGGRNFINAVYVD